MTIKELLEDIKIAVLKDKSVLNKEILLSQDEEGNGYHPMYFSITANEKDVKECIECSNGVSSMEDVDYNKYVILG